MKNITIELNRRNTPDEKQIEIVKNINERFVIIDDSQDKYDNLRFILIEGTDLRVDLNNGVTIQSITRPHIFVSIYEKYVYAVEVVL